MATSLKDVLTFWLACLMVSIVMSRPLSSNSTLAARLKLDQQGSSNSKCWDSLFELQSCTAELIIFFLNGDTYIGPSCCDAIQTVQHDCWPGMLGSLGFTSREGDILRGYCDASTPPLPPRTLNTTSSVSHPEFP